jgi:hypothetical protein
MSIPHNHPPRIGQKFEYCGAVIVFRQETKNFFVFEKEGEFKFFYKDEFANLNLKAIT